MLQGSRYPIGSLSRMGPGFYPMALGAILALVGLALIATARFSRTQTEDKVLPPEWRGWFLICASIVAFVVLGKYGGLVPATFAVVFISALADRENTLLAARGPCSCDRRASRSSCSGGRCRCSSRCSAGADG